MIKINENYYINAVPTCYILQKNGIIQDKDSKNYGEKYQENIGYYTTLKGAINGIIKTESRKFIAKEDINSLEDLKKEIEKLEETINKACKGLLD